MMPPGGLASNSTASSAIGNASTSAISAAVSNTTNGFVATAPNQIVAAPKPGDLRFVPFAVNVDAGKTVDWFWGAGPHTVTQSSALEVCNKTKASNAFVSGMRNATSTFGESFPRPGRGVLLQNGLLNPTRLVWRFSCAAQQHRHNLVLLLRPDSLPEGECPGLNIPSL